MRKYNNTVESFPTTFKILSKSRVDMGLALTTHYLLADEQDDTKALVCFKELGEFHPVSFRGEMQWHINKEFPEFSNLIAYSPMGYYEQ